MKVENLKAIVRPAVTIGVAAGVIGGFFDGKLTSEQFMSVAMLCIGFYFVQRSAKQ